MAPWLVVVSRFAGPLVARARVRTRDLVVLRQRTNQLDQQGPSKYRVRTAGEAGRQGHTREALPRPS